MFMKPVIDTSAELVESRSQLHTQLLYIQAILFFHIYLDLLSDILQLKLKYYKGGSRHSDWLRAGLPRGSEFESR
jgi:hypothetical protein